MASHKVVELSLNELSYLWLVYPLWNFALGLWIVINSSVLVRINILHVIVLQLVIKTHLSSLALSFWKLTFVRDKCVSHSKVTFLLQPIALIHRSFSFEAILVLHSFLISIINIKIVVLVKLCVGFVVSKNNSQYRNFAGSTTLLKIEINTYSSRFSSRSSPSTSSSRLDGSSSITASSSEASSF